MRSSRFDDRIELEQLLLLGDLERQVRGDRVGELGRLLDLVDRDDDLGRHLLVQLHVVLELRDHGARGGLQLGGIAGASSISTASASKNSALSVKPAISHAPAALDQHLHGAVGQLQQLQHGAERADACRCRRAPGSSWLAFFWATSRICLSSFITSSSALHALLAADEQRHDHVRETRRCRAAAGRDRRCLAVGAFMMPRYYAVRAAAHRSRGPRMGDPRRAGTRTR